MSGSVQTFISYRRADAEDAAGRIYDALTARFDDDDVFMDIDAIEPGLDFTKVIRDAVARCDALIAVIGRSWWTATDAQGRRRLDNPNDFVRIEIAAALDREVRVIPALVQGVEMPQSAELPEQLAALADRHAVDLSHDRFRAGVAKLIRALESLEREKATDDDQPPPGVAGARATQGRSRSETIAARIADDDQRIADVSDESARLVLQLMRVGGDEYEVAASGPAGDAVGEFRVPLTPHELENLVLRLGQPRGTRWR